MWGKISSCFRSIASVVEALLKMAPECRFLRFRDLQVPILKWESLCWCSWIWGQEVQKGLRPLSTSFPQPKWEVYVQVPTINKPQQHSQLTWYWGRGDSPQMPKSYLPRSELFTLGCLCKSMDLNVSFSTWLSKQKGCTIPFGGCPSHIRLKGSRGCWLRLTNSLFGLFLSLCSWYSPMHFPFSTVHLPDLHLTHHTYLH